MKYANTYLHFNGNCRQAVDFYTKCLGAEVEIMTYDQMPGDMGKAAPDRILHSRIHKANQTIVMCSDGMPSSQLIEGTNFAVALACESHEEIDRLFVAFSEKATITMPLADTFWNARFGMLKDQFGINWMFNWEKPKAA